jgi:hypothetical protein
MNIETRIKNWQIVENWTEIVGKKIAIQKIWCEY